MKKAIWAMMLALLPLGAAAQTAEQIMADDNYIWGEGYGDTDQAADQAALQNLVSKISVSVQSEFTIDEREVNSSEGSDAKSIMESVVKTYSMGSLTNTRSLVLSHQPDAHVLRYVEKKEVERVFEEREDRIFDYMRSAQNAEKDGRIDDALRCFYWGYTLLKSLQHPNKVKFKERINPMETEDHLLMGWIPERMNAILGNLSAEIVDSDPETGEVNLFITYKGKPVTTLDFRYNDGQNFSNICSAKNGLGQVEMRPGAPTDRVQLKYEYEFSGQSRIDRELEMVMKVFHNTPFPKATVTIAASKKREQKKAQEDFQAAVQSVGVATNAVEAMNPDEYGPTVLEVVEAIKQRNYESVKDRFTDEGYRMFDALVHYGNAKVLGVPELHFYEHSGRTICRSIPMSFTFKNNRRQFVEDVTFTFDGDKKIESVAFAMGKDVIDDILNRTTIPWSDSVRMGIITFLENYKTAFALKRLDYIRSIFDDNAIIITGHVTKAAKHNAENDKYLTNENVKFNKVDKETYLKNLAKCFDSNEFVNIRFTDNDMKRMGVGGDLFGIQIHQDYYSSNYGDTGYLFLMVDLNKVYEPCIKVRTWQPHRDPNVNGGLPKDNPYFGLFHGGNF